MPDDRVTAAELDALHDEYHRTRDAHARETLVIAYQPLARHFAWRFRNSSEPFDDLVQVASLALVAAVDRFDPTRGVKFTSYAGRVIVGELKRHFRDRTWRVHVPRALQERALALTDAVESLRHDLGRSPSIGELAAELGIDEEDVVEAMDVVSCYRPRSLDTLSGDRESGPVDISTEEPGFEQVERILSRRKTLTSLLALLDDEDRELLALYYGAGLSQHDVGRKLGHSQVTVSRRLRKVIERLRVCSAAML